MKTDSIIAINTDTVAGQNIFSNFTRKYQLSKTLRFELKPVPRTRNLLNLGNENQKIIFPEDKVLAENYAIIKKYIDELHARFINAALALLAAYIEVTDSKVLKEKQEKSSDEQEAEDTEAEEKEEIKSKHHKKIIWLFNQLGAESNDADKPNRFSGWVKIDNKNKVSGKLFGKELIDILREEFKEELDKDIDVPVLFFNRNEKGKKRKLRDVFNSFKAEKNEDGKKGGQNFTTYFTTVFHDSIKNYYKGDGKAGRVATRIIDENLKRFIANKEKFGNIQKAASGDGEEIKNIQDEKNKLDLIEKYETLLKSFDDKSSWMDFESKKAKKAELPRSFNYENWKEYAFGNKYGHFLQEKINAYNFFIGKLNKSINESGVRAGRFLRLHKQIHGEVKKLDEAFYVDEGNIFGSDQPFIKRFTDHSKAKLVSSEKIFGRFLRERYSEPEKVFISKRAINTISSRCFANWNSFGGAILEYWNDKEKKQRQKLPDFVDLQTIKEVLDGQKDTTMGELFKFRYFEKIEPKDKSSEQERESLEKLQAELKEGEHWQNFLRIMRYEFDSLKEKHNQTAERLLAETTYKKGDKQQIALLFDFAESANGLMNMTKYFALRKKGAMVEDKRYANRDEIHEMVENYLDGNDDGTEERCLINQYYKTLKHFVSQKPWIEDKIVLTFENPVLLGGWNQTKEKECRGVLLEQDRRYYFGYLNNKKAFDYYFNEDDFYSNGKRKGTDALKKNWSEKLGRFQKARAQKDGEELYNKIEIYQIADASKDVSLLLSRATDYNLKKFKKDYEKQGKNFNEIKKIKKDESYKITKENFSLANLRTIIDYYKTCLPVQDLRKIDEYKDVSDFEKTVEQKGYSNWRHFDFKLSPTDTYKNINEFTNELEWSGYRLDTVRISKNYIDELVQRGDLYLFQIYNKDFELDEEIGKEEYGNKFVSKKEWRRQEDRRDEEKRQGRENEHTTFFKLLFDQSNLKNKEGMVYKLSGGAKIFYRPASKDLKKKDDRYGKEILERQRYGVDKLMLNVPIMMNFVSKNEGWKINNDINELIYNTPFGQDKFRIIALDRGEKNLVYLTVLNEDRKILQIGSLNYITRFDKKGEPIKEKNQYCDKDGNPKGAAKIEEFKDYHNLLDQKQIERLKARKSWGPIEKIANLKKGYLGFVTNKIASLVVSIIQEGRIPIVALENLNVGMKQGRIQIEKQVYSKVEEKIAKKLSYLVDKGLDNFLSAWQLTPNIKTFGGDIEDKDRVGVIFYINPSYTSSTCPRCGFRKRKYIKADKVKEEFKNIKISFYGAKYIFDFSSEVDEVYSNVRRVIWDKRAKNGRGDSKEIDDVTEMLTKLFKEFGVNANNGNLGEQIQRLMLSKEREKEFWVRLLKWLNCILEIRNSTNKKRTTKDGDAQNTEIEEWGKDRDFIFCPHCYFDSENKEALNQLREERYIGNNPQNFEFNGDANGAYNTGRKGIIAVKKIKDYEQKKIKFKDTFGITEWPKNENDKIPLAKGLVLRLINLEEGIKKKSYYYCVLDKEAKMKPKEKTIEHIFEGKRLRKRPDLFISDSDWDDAVSDWDVYLAKRE